MSKLKILWSFMRGYRLLYLAAVLAVVMETLFAYIAPLIIRGTIDSVIGDKVLVAPDFVLRWIEWLGGISTLQKNLWLVGLGLLLVTACQGVFSYLKGRSAATASESIARNIRESLYHHLQCLPCSFHSKAETGDLIQRCTSDIETIRRFLAMQCVEVGRSLIMIALVVPIMLHLDQRMTMVAMAAVPLIFIFAVVFFAKVKAAFKLSDEAEGEMSSVLQESLTGIRVVRAFARQDYEKEKFNQKNMQYRDRNYALIRLLASYFAISDFFCLTQLGVVLILGAMWTVAGQLSLGTLVVFLTYEGMLLWPVRHMGQILTDLGKTMVSLGRVQEILTESAEEVGKTAGTMKSIKGNIVFDGVSFAYVPGIPVLQDISFQVEAGQTVALVGPTGAGKSTLVNLLPRLYDYQKGSIFLDGNELRSIDKQWLRRRMGIVLQEPFLYSRSLRENISLGQLNAVEEQVFEAARIASIHDVILGFEKGYDTVVGERGTTLSGGQKQRLVIARAILRQAPILIFDDSLSAVDTETEAHILKSLRLRRGQCTTFVIAHRFTTVAEADLILFLEQGRIVQRGTHQQLLHLEGPYRKFWNIQNNLEEQLIS